MLSTSTAPSSSLRIAIVGAGLGGLCLAQSLRRRGLRADVFERDASPWDRPQGYRLHLDVDGIHALHDALSPALFAAFDATSMKPAPFTTIVDTHLEVRARRTHDQHGGTSEIARDGLPAHVNVNRATLREILLAELDGCVRFDARVASLEERGEEVRIHFADGATYDADLVIGADGIRSMVRAHRAPHARTQDSGVRAIYGRLPFAVAARLPAVAREDVFTVAVDERKCFFGLGPVVFPQRPERTHPRLTPQDDYVVCIVGGHTDHLEIDDATLHRCAPRALRVVAESWIRAWPASTRGVLAHADPDAFFAVEMWTSVPSSLAAPRRITLLGDAIHAMTPTLGRGANVALRDAARLGRAIAERGDASIEGVLAAYEREMLAYGFDVVRRAAAMGTQLMGQRPLPE